MRSRTRGREMPSRDRPVLAWPSTVVAGLVVLMVGVGTGYWLQPATDPAERVDRGPGPNQRSDGVATGYARNEKGAAAAAMNHLVALYDDAVAQADRGRVLDVVAAEGARDWLNAHITEAMGPDADEEWPVARGGAVGYDVAAYDDDEAIVEVWVAASAAGGDVWGLRETPGRVGELELVWQDDDWRVNRARLLEVDDDTEARMGRYDEVWHVPAG